jgi:hypothetical protein
MVPGALTVSDLDDIAAVWMPRPLSIEAAIDGRNQPVTGKELRGAYLMTQGAGKEALTLRDMPASAEALAAWFAGKLPE